MKRDGKETGNGERWMKEEMGKDEERTGGREMLKKGSEEKAER